MRRTVLTCVVAALVAAAAPAATAPAAAGSTELGELTVALERLVVVLESEADQRRGTETLRQLGELDRMVVALEADLRERRNARNATLRELRAIETELTALRATLDTIESPEDPGSLATLIASAGGTVTVDALEAELDAVHARGEIARDDLARIDAEIAARRATLDERLALRDEIEERATAELGGDR